MAWRGEARHGEVGQGKVKAAEFSQPPFSIDRKESICLDALTRGEIPHRTHIFLSNSLAAGKVKAKLNSPTF
jgi:hypothetical protein